LKSILIAAIVPHFILLMTAKTTNQAFAAILAITRWRLC